MEENANPMPSEISALLAAWAGGRGYDLILAGTLSEDDMHGQTGPMVAAHLDWPWATSAVRLDVHPGEEAGREGPCIGVEREVEGGRREILAIRLPALVAVQSGINRPRYPALSHVLRARSQGLTEVPSDTLPAPEIRSAPSGSRPRRPPPAASWKGRRRRRPWSSSGSSGTVRCSEALPGVQSPSFQRPNRIFSSSSVRSRTSERQGL
jgi:electron transfer flavoprotein alpha/beta subunit